MQRGAALSARVWHTCAVTSFVAAWFGCGSSSVAPGFIAMDKDAATLRDGGLPPGDSASFSVGEGSVGDGSNGDSAEVFGTSADTLYMLNPITKALAVVGTFAGCTQVTDIALDKDSNLFGTTIDGLYRIDRRTARCALIVQGTYPNSLSFVPAGTLDANQEALVGYVGDRYVRIDPQTGSISNVGSLGGGLRSSGDIVSVKGGGTYLTAKSSSCNDCLIEVDPATGRLLKNWGPLGYADVYGLAFWAGAVYGFDNGGDLFEVDFHGAALQATRIPIVAKPAALAFSGAGSTTLAPPIANK